jgi:hypothetical protein
MSFLLGMDLKFFRPRHRLITVGDVTIKDCGDEERIAVTCFADTGTLFMDGKFAPAHLTIGESLNWFLGETITDMDIEELYFDNSKVNGERPAHAWEKRTFLLGHWKQYARHISMEEEKQPILDRNHEQQPSPLIIQPFS